MSYRRLAVPAGNKFLSPAIFQAHWAPGLPCPGLAPGNYTAAIEIKDMVTRKSVKQDAPFTIVP
jgi:hypothetical protein